MILQTWNNKDGTAKQHAISEPCAIPMSVPYSSTINHHIFAREDNRITRAMDLFRYRQTCCDRGTDQKRRG